MKRYSALIVLILSTGCMRAEVRSEQYTELIGTPYRKVLVCVISPDPARVTQMETVVTERLRRIHIAVEKGTDVFVSSQESSPERVLVQIQQNFDAVLVIERKKGQATSSLQEL